MTTQTRITDLIEQRDVQVAFRKRPLHEVFRTRMRAQRVADLLAELRQDMWLFDPRNWRKAGMTEREVRLRYENGWRVPSDGERFPVVSAKRGLLYVLPLLRNSFEISADVIVEALMPEKDKRLVELALHWEHETGDWIRGAQEGELLIEDARGVYREWRRVLALLNMKPPSFDLMCRMVLVGRTLEKFRPVYGWRPRCRHQTNLSHGGETHGNKEQT